MKQINFTKNKLKNYFLETYKLDESLYNLIKNEKSFYEKPNRLRHPLIFYYAHTATFYINKLLLAKMIDKRINKHFESIFAIGVDEMSWDDIDEKNYQWPQYEDVKDYREKVKDIVCDVIDNLDYSTPLQWDSPIWVILMGIEHQNIHIETSSVLLRELPLELVYENKNITKCDEYDLVHYKQNELLHVKGQKIILGRDKNNPLEYGWDNEFGLHEANIKDFQASKYLVSNGEYLEFIKDGGYEDGKYFSKEGKKWLSFLPNKLPHFWIRNGEKYFLREIDRIVPLPLNYPVDVNFYEAEAFCKYKSKQLGIDIRLPSEDEYYCLYEYVNAQEKDANNNLKYFNQTPIDKFSFNDFYDVKGNVWQWSITPIYPFPGFETHPIYDDFTTPTFDNEHALIKGNSFISLGNETNKYSRYAFRKHFFQHAGFRYVSSNNKTTQEACNTNIYETDELISQYCEFHYGDEHFGVKNFMQNSVEIVSNYIQDIPKKKVLDLGCSVGRSCFEFAKIFENVVGIDFSANFINVGVKLQDNNTLNFKVKEEGDIFYQKEINLQKLGFEDLAQKITFMQGDACNLKDIYNNFDLIFCSNLIDRLYDPQKFLNDIQSRINKGGYLVISSPYTWLEEYTPKENWLGGYIKDGDKVYTIDTLKESLQEKFKLIDTIDVPFVIKETNRKFQHSVSHMSIWKKL